jgi:hypothetical protein
LSIRALGRSLRGDTILNRAPGTLDTHQNGIHLDFVNQYYYTKAAGVAPVAGALTSLFTFTRAAPDATFRGRDGTLQYATTNVPRIEYDAPTISGTNYALQSQDLSTSHSLAALLAFGAGSTVNATAAPDGTVTADKIVEDTATTLHRIRQSADISIAAGAVVTFSYHVKAAERTRCRLRITENTFASSYEVSFNLTTGTVGAAVTTGVATGFGSGIIPLPNGWYRIWISASINGVFTTCRTNLELEDATGSNAYTGTGTSGLFAWGEQFEFGVGPTTYTPTTTITPQFSTNSGGCLGLLMEATKTNLCLQSADLATTWTLSGATASANAVTAPDGTLTADNLVEAAAGTFHLIRQDIVIAANTPHTFSFFVKPAGRTSCKVQVSNTLENSGSNVDVNLITGTISNLVNFGTGASSAATIELWGNGWYRVSLRTTIDAASTTGRVQILLSNPVGTTSYSGDAVSGLSIWGAQYEAAQFMSSYIPTTTIAVARAADSCVRTLGAEFLATAGSMIVYGRAMGGQSTRQTIAAFSDGTAANVIPFVRPGSTNSIQLRIDAASVNQSAPFGTIVNSAPYKVGGAWAANNVNLFYNGIDGGINNVATLPAGITTLGIGIEFAGSTASANGHIRRFHSWPERKSDAFLRQWTGGYT